MDPPPSVNLLIYKLTLKNQNLIFHDFIDFSLPVYYP